MKIFTKKLFGLFYVLSELFLIFLFNKNQLINAFDLVVRGYLSWFLDILLLQFLSPGPGLNLGLKTTPENWGGGGTAPNQRLACFALYLKIVNTFVQENVYILRQIVKGTHNGIGILVGQAVFKLSQSKYCFDQ